MAERKIVRIDKLPASYRARVVADVQHEEAVKRLQRMLSGNQRLRDAIAEVDGLTHTEIGDDEDPRPGSIHVIRDWLAGR